MAEKLKVCIAGYAAEGTINYKYWSDLGHEVAIADERNEVEGLPEGVHTILGEGAFSKLHDYDLVVRTASLNPAKIFTHGKIWSATNEFFEKCPTPIIGVTGTKGKGTTCSLIAKILEEAGQTVHLVGNIGVPALRELSKIKEEDIVVFELSSFQLWDLKKSPHVAVWLMMEPDHLNIHASMEEYIDAKFNITAHQANEDILIHHPTNQYIKPKVEESNALKIPFMSDHGANIVGDEIIIEGKKICKVEEVGLLGAHNLENICAAITASWQYTQDLAAIKSAVTSFKGLPHRLEFVRNINGVKYYDDSQATGVGSCLAAIRAFHVPTVLILGGSDKGVDVSSVVSELDPARHSVVLIGQASDMLEHQLNDRDFRNYKKLGQRVTMSEIVKAAQDLSQKDGVVLLSPAHASFDMFKSYEDRGEQFKQAVRDL